MIATQGRRESKVRLWAKARVRRATGRRSRLLTYGALLLVVLGLTSTDPLAGLLAALVVAVSALTVACAGDSRPVPCSSRVEGLRFSS